VIAITDLTVRFGGMISLDDLTVTLDSPRAGLIGANVQGRTTFFNELSGFVKPSAGKVQVLGTDLLESPYRPR
jgi:ABC-type branched-subunit amino acid transport system ATPase component